MIRTIVFDFDGVIAESVAVKTAAFAQLFSAYPQYLDAILAHHRANGGMSRYEKFRYYYAQILHQELTPQMMTELGDRFNTLVKEAVIAAPLVRGIEEVLDSCHQRYPLHIVSGTPEEEMKEIVLRRGIQRYFSSVNGSPTAKAVHLKRILDQTPCRPQEMVFIGDSLNDQEAAVATGVRFIGRGNPQDFPKTAPERCVQDFIGFTAYLAGKETA